MATDDVLEILAEQLGRPVDKIVELDRRPFRLLVNSGSYLTVTLRDRVTREILEPTLDLEAGTLIDADELRTRDREEVDARTAIAPRLRRLLLRHPGLPPFEVLVVRTGGETERVSSDAAGVLVLADDPEVSRVDIVGETEIRD